MCIYICIIVNPQLFMQTRRKIGSYAHRWATSRWPENSEASVKMSMGTRQIRSCSQRMSYATHGVGRAKSAASHEHAAYT